MKKELQDLVFIGRIEKNVTICGKNFVLTTLNAKQNIEATAETDRYDPFARVGALKISTLARSLKRVEDIIIDSVQEAKEFLNGLDDYVVDELYNKYLELKEEQQKALQDIKN